MENPRGKAAEKKERITQFGGGREKGWPTTGAGRRALKGKRGGIAEQGGSVLGGRD